MPFSRRSRFAIGSELLLLLGACSVEAADQPHSVILICMDTVRADHLGCYGYEEHPTTPALDELAKSSIVFTDASATAGWTKPSVPSYLTGTYPCQHGVYEGSARLEQGDVTDVLPEDAETLAEAFSASGYRTAAFVHNAQLRRGNGFEQGFELYRDQAGDARQVRWQAQDWLDELEGDRPFFLYLHVLDAHWPYPVPDEYATLFASPEDVAPYRGKDSRRLRDAINDGEVVFGERERETVEALYDGAIRYVDDQVGALLRWLERRDLAEKTVVCVISDHGEEFGEHGRIGHGHGLHENLLRVPWILHVPGRGGSSNDTPVSLVDLYPTLLTAAGLRGGKATEGIDRILRPDDERMIFAEHKAPDRYLQSLRRGDLKLVRDFEPSERVAGDAFPVAVGERWEAELERAADGRLRAAQLKPRDEPPSDPMEVKDSIRALSAGGFSLGGIEVRTTEATQRVLTEGVTNDDLADGLLVKVRGAFADGVFQAERIKIYGADAEPAFEIRGRVEEVGIDRLRIGAAWIGFDADTSFKDVPERRRGLPREAVLRILESGELEARREGIEVERRVYDLLRSPLELEPEALAPDGDELAGALDELGRSLVARRVFGDGDRRVLNEEALNELKAIGYVE